MLTSITHYGGMVWSNTIQTMVRAHLGWGRKRLRASERCAPELRSRTRARPIASDTIGCRLALHWLVILSVAGGGVACGGGGGSGSVGTKPASFFETEEFNANYGLGAIRASSAYAAGATGRGVTVGVIDTGIDVDHPEFASAIDADSTDIVADDPGSLDDVDGHGTAVAGVIAARRNDALAHGVAFNARLLVVRADAPGSCASMAGCAFDQGDVADATDYAVANGARVINYSLGGVSLDPPLRTAMVQAVDAGTILVLSAGNGAAAEPTFPARFAADPDADGQVIAVGAVNASNQIAGFSNRAGSTRDFFLVAPGVDVLSTALGGGAALVSGTSFAAPHVAGAAALVLEAAPFLSAAQVVELLLDTATDLGAPGTDDVYGRGLVNLKAALGPQGPLSVPLGTAVDDRSAPLAGTGLRLGRAFGSGPDLGRAIFLDGYGRPYRFALDDQVARPASAPDLHRWMTRTDGLRSVTVSLGADLALGLSFVDGDVDPVAPDDETEISDRFALDLAVGRSSRLTATRGVGLQHRFGLGGSEAVGAGALLTQEFFGSPYLALADGGDGLALSQDLGNGFALRFGIATDDDEPDDGLASGRQTALVGELVRRWQGGHRASLQFGSLEEDAGLLDASGAGALGLPQSATTTFVGASAHVALGDGLALFGEASLGLTRPDGAASGLLVDVSPLRSSSFAAGISARRLLAAHDRLTLAVAQPLRIDGGSATLDLPVARSLEGEILRRKERVDLAPDGREIDLEVGYRLAFGSRRELDINWLTRLQPGHRADAAPEHALAIRLRTRF